MAIEESLDKIGEQLERIADALDQFAGFNEDAPEVVPPEESEETEEEKPKKPKSKSTTMGKVTEPQLRGKLNDVIKALGKGPGRDAVIELLKEHGDGAKGMKGLDEAHYKAVHDAAQDLLDA